MSDKKLMTVAAGAEYLSVSPKFLRAERAAHRIRFVDISRGNSRKPTYRVEVAELDRWAADLPTAIPKHT